MRQLIQSRQCRLCFSFFVLVAIAATILTGCMEQTAPGMPSPSPSASAPHKLRIHFIDVGQADAILVQTPEGENLLIDGGNGPDGDAVVEYLKSQGVGKLTAVVATHPHEDHIGGLPKVLQELGTKTLYMPDAVNTTKTFERLLDAADKGADRITAAQTRLGIRIGSAEATFLSPDVGAKVDELNDYSAVIRLKYGATTMLFTGDAEKPVEEKLLKAGGDLRADLLKVGHHGGSTSTSEAFLEAVAPKLAVIMVGNDNDYGHPHRETMQRLEKTSARILRTDRDGTIVVASDGKTLTIEKPLVR